MGEKTTSTGVLALPGGVSWTHTSTVPFSLKVNSLEVKETFVTAREKKVVIRRILKGKLHNYELMLA